MPPKSADRALPAVQAGLQAAVANPARKRAPGLRATRLVPVDAAQIRNNSSEATRYVTCQRAMPAAEVEASTSYVTATSSCRLTRLQHSASCVWPRRTAKGVLW